ncbi:hypothetical protein [Speluncibacter jeojiensis]|uniref:Lipoprotein n=1 Tax=Speluncibacter jeojiensis TaxID=2710754 RepID=A0A9X4REY2_9ACTN|nr:hypothetical protein [Corynebacteriales bacterium D3-21]
MVVNFARWRRTAGAAFAALAAATAVSGCTSNSSGATGGLMPLVPPKAGPVTVDAHTVPGLGPILVDANGYTLYTFPPDDRQIVSCTGACQGSWPPVRLTGSVAPQAGHGVNPALLGSLPDPTDGGRVATYNGWPLYAYAGDVGPGQLNGQGLNLNGDEWYVIGTDGVVIVPPGQVGHDTATGDAGPQGDAMAGPGMSAMTGGKP